MQITVKCPKTLSSICSLNFLPEFRHNACFSPNHWWCAVCSHTDSTGLVHSDPVQRFNESAKNVIRCSGVCHRYQLKELLGDRQSLINTTNEYGQLSNICNVSRLQLKMLQMTWLYASFGYPNLLKDRQSYPSQYSSLGLCWQKPVASQGTRFLQPSVCMFSQTYPHSMAFRLMLFR